MHDVRSLVLLALLAPLLFASAGAEEAVLRDGRRLSGKLELRENHLQFVPAGEQAALRLDQLHQVRFPPARGPTCLGGSFFQVALADGQRLTGELLGLDAQTLQVRAPWGRLAIPREAVHALTQPPGYLSLVDEDFESALGAWKLTGPGALDGRQHISGRKSLLLKSSSRAEMALAQSLASGCAGVSFFDAGNARGTRGLVELIFQRGKETDSLRIVVGGDRQYGVEPGGTPGELGRLARSDGWHRLVVGFAPQSVRVAIDDLVLWSSRLKNDAVLSKVRLACIADPAKGVVDGNVWFDDFTLARAVGDLRHDAADPRQDEVWLASGDQLLGRVVRADRRSVELDARFGKRTLSWGEVRGLYLRQAKTPAPKAEPDRARVWLRAASGGELDQLVGKVCALSDNRLTLRHALLGELEIERTWLRRIATAE